MQFQYHLTELEILSQLTALGTPQQNGVAERRNRTLKEMANCMLQSKGLGLSFWAEAINCANYIINRTPTKVLNNITPEEAWSSIKLDVSHFRVFGSEAWAHIPDEKHKALEPKSEKCTFVGYSKDVKGYRLTPFKSKNVIIRRGVKFYEDTMAYELGLTDVPPLPTSSTFENISSLMMKARMKIIPHLLRILLQLLSFQDGSVLLGMQQVILPVILQISAVHVRSLNGPLLYWLKLQ